MESTITFEFEEKLNKIRVSSSSANLYTTLLDVYTVQNPLYVVLRNKGIYGVEETISPITALGLFDIGLFPLVYKTALEIVNKDTSRIIISEKDKVLIQNSVIPLKNIIPSDYTADELCQEKPMRWYQRQAVELMMRSGRCIIEGSTGSGKSLMLANLINELRHNNFPKMGEKTHILVVVPTRQLVDQMYDDFTSYGLTDICRFTSDSGKKKDGTYKDNSCNDGFSNVIISNHAWICEKYQLERFPIDKIGCVIADEVHTVTKKSKKIGKKASKSSSHIDIVRVIEKIKPILRFGCTGTLPTNDYVRWGIIGTFGISLLRTDIQTLQEEKILSDIEIYPILGHIKEMDTAKHLPFSLNRNRNVRLGSIMDDGTEIEFGTAFKLETKYFEDNAVRLYTPMLEKINDYYDFKNHNMIILFDRTVVGNHLLDICKKLFPYCKVHYFDGSIDISIREKTRSDLEKSVGNILIAQSVTASVGLNIRNLHAITFCFSGKSYIKVVQSIGRVLRKMEGKESAKLFELYFNTRYSTSHHQEKMDIFRDNYGKKSIKKVEKVEI